MYVCMQKAVSRLLESVWSLDSDDVKNAVTTFKQKERITEHLILLSDLYWLPLNPAF